MKVELGDGDWALLRHPNKIPHRQTLAYRHVFFQMAGSTAGANGEDSEALGRAMVENGGLDAMEELANALVLAVVKEWSFGEVDEETLLDVPTADLKTIQEHCAGDEYRQVLNPDFAGSLEPDSPTKPSAP